jgi:hypothetical protein
MRSRRCAMKHWLEPPIAVPVMLLVLAIVYGVLRS